MDEEATRTAASAPASVTPRPRSGGGRFVSGTLLGGRYRIVTLLGTGGMGEVYKADDLKLDHPVALKFLPETLAFNATALARFHAEARIARQVSHPNVCRVYDIGDVDGLHFLTMEFIDGEDLATLLRRIGRLPGDRAVTIARQLCAGLAAAHEAGVLHRDLKPANVMIDGRGRARITDFGIAGIAREVRGETGFLGTPAYMAPEQLKGQDAAVRTDVYALGLVLYELFTGRRAIEAQSLADALLKQTSGAPVETPSTWVADLDPIVERAILRCLENDPARRPASAVQLAAALPGGDPIQIALAAGETPSPEMVAAGSGEAMRPAAALAVLGVTLAVLVAGAWTRANTSVLGRTSVDLAPQVLAHMARQILAQFDYADARGDSAFGFNYDQPFVRHVRFHIEPSLRWKTLEAGRPSAVRFWYRESPLPLLAGGGLYQEVTPSDPPLTEPGMVLVHLDPKGRLAGFRALPDLQPGPAIATDWSRVFTAAALDRQRFQAAEPAFVPRVWFDDRAAWTGTYPEQPDLPMRIEAAAHRGRLVSVEIRGPWTQPAAGPATPGPRGARGLTTAALTLALFIAAAVTAWRNVRAGRGDRRGAFRAAAVLFVTLQIGWLLVSDHTLGASEGELIQMGLGQTLLASAGAYVLFLALEPYVRRNWPEVLVAWSRLVAGRVTDHRVGREVLYGVAFGAVWLLGTSAILWGTRDFSTSSRLAASLDVRGVGGLFADSIGWSVVMALLLCFAAVLLREAFRGIWLAAATLVVIIGGINGLSPEGWYMTAGLSYGLLALLAVVALTRLGLLSVVVLLAVHSVLMLVPTTLDLSAWYADVSIVTIAAIGAAAVYACFVAIGRRPPLRRAAGT